MIGVVLTARALRAFADGFISVLLPAYLLALGHGQFAVGVLSTTTLIGSALATLAIGHWSHRCSIKRLLLGAAALMALTGLGFAGASSLWPLLLVAFMGTLNPSSGDVGIFLPLEHTLLATGATPERQTVIFARYSFIGSVSAACGALAVAIPQWLTHATGLTPLDALRLMFCFYGVVGCVIWALYLRIPQVHADNTRPAAALGPSRRMVWKLAGLFCVDAFAGGLIMNSLLALWLFDRFGMSLAAAGAFFFWTGLLGAASQLAAPAVARRFGLVNTMVFTHMPSNLFLIAAALVSDLDVALGFLFARSALSQMDVPARSAFVMSVVTPAERPAAASFTMVPRTLASAIGPSLAGAFFAAGALAAPLIACGLLKTAYDIALFFAFRRVKPRTGIP